MTRVDCGASYSEPKIAIKSPIVEVNQDASEGAINELIKWAKGCPNFLQEWECQRWNIAQGDVIGLSYALAAALKSIKILGDSYFKDTLIAPPQKREYVIAIAKFGSGPHKAADVVDTFGEKL